MLFHPANSPIPEQLRGDGFLIRPIKPEDVQLHYEAISASRDMLKKWSGGTWPTDDFTLESDIAELAQAKEWHDKGAAYTFGVFSEDESELLGMVHVDSLMQELHIGQAEEDDLTTVMRFEGVVRFWVRPSFVERDFDRALMHALVEWLDNEWNFQRVLYRINSTDLRQVEILSGLGRRHLYVLDPPDRNGKHILHG